MTEFWVGLVIGWFSGLVVMSCLSMAGDADRREKKCTGGSKMGKGNINVPTVNWGFGVCLKKCKNRSKRNCDACVKVRGEYSNYKPEEERDEQKVG